MAAAVNLSPAQATDLLDALDGGVALLNLDLTIDFANASAERLFRNTRAQLRGRPIASVLRDATKLTDMCQRALSEGVTLVLREFYVHPLYSADQRLRADVVVSPYGNRHLLLEWRDNNWPTKSKTRWAACAARPSCWLSVSTIRVCPRSPT